MQKKKKKNMEKYWQLLFILHDSNICLPQNPLGH